MAADGPLHLIKLCVGVARLEDLVAWQRDRRSRAPDGRVRHVTRMWPRRADEILNGGSLYWVMKGSVLARQRILAFEPIDAGEAAPRCGVVLDPELVRTQIIARKPFQGWRYLTAADAPPDLDAAHGEGCLPPGLEEAIAEFGVARRRVRCD